MNDGIAEWQASQYAGINNRLIILCEASIALSILARIASLSRTASEHGGVSGASSYVFVAVEHLIYVVEVGAGFGLGPAALLVLVPE